jgi:hypothetical protein
LGESFDGSICRCGPRRAPAERPATPSSSGPEGRWSYLPQIGVRGSSTRPKSCARTPSSRNSVRSRPRLGSGGGGHAGQAGNDLHHAPFGRAICPPHPDGPSPGSDELRLLLGNLPARPPGAGALARPLR